MRKSLRKKSIQKKKAQTRPFPDKDSGVVLQLAMDRFNTQQQQISALDGKLSNLLGLGSALLAILAASLALGEDHISRIPWIFSGISFFVYIILASSSLHAYLLRGFEVGPDLGETWDYSRESKEKTIGWWAAESFTTSYENNQDKVELKIRAAKRGVWLIAGQTITLTIGLFILVLC